MSESSAADLALAFRSFDRRLREALAPLAGDHQPVAVHLERFHGAISTAARALKVTSTTNAIADSLAAQRPAERDETTLRDVRAAALDAGAALRDLADAAAARAGDADS